MGSITFTAVGNGGVGTKTKTFVVSDADVNRIVAFARAAATTQALPNPTIAQGMLWWADNIMATLKTDVKNYERQLAYNAVVEPIAITAT